ncbi:zinc finger MYM-type protein 1-like [Panicum virgatum]|uniref:zinc finger MYM-type protein 1-like n=1 Tax=Panicum virgatum TaxID=38727 RepID=UPI0019D63304|nr:zinc finger MYM-type protein 1-like [Panicum virgatum]
MEDPHSLQIDAVGGDCGEGEQQITHVGSVENEVSNEEVVDKSGKNMITPEVGMSFESEDKAFKMYNTYAGKNQPSGQLKRMVVKQSTEDVKWNRLRLRVIIDTVQWLPFQACAFCGHDESADSNNQSNFLEMVQLLAEYDDKVKAVVLGNAKYTSLLIQKEILDIIASKTQKLIHDEIGDAKFCLIVDESRDEYAREQMTLVVHFVDKEGFIRERFLDIAHVHDTTSATLKKEICSLLASHKLDVQNIRGQGYDGASNMRGEWNGLQAKILADCPYAYYVHCFAHQLQLALVAASKEMPEVSIFLYHLSFVVNTVVSSSKRNDDLSAYQIAEMENLIDLGELETGSGANRIGTLKQAG